ncbi:MAG: SAVED domain-containing protein [Rhodocyclaceae bacterium]|nr:SAVED domain-containing protein [Rhodocyclaceae bacterium]
MELDLWLTLDRASIAVGIILAIPVFWTWWQVVFGERQQRKKRLADISRSPGHRPSILIVDLLPGKNIKGGVVEHIHKDAELKKIPKELIQEIVHTQALRTTETLDLVNEMRTAIRKLMESGVDVIHLFYGGPGIAALLLGAELSNGARVLMYHYEQGSYLNFGVLEPLRYEKS